MIVIIDTWIKSVKNNIKQQKKSTPEIKRFCGKFNDNYIREKIYDYLSENMAMGLDGNYKIVIHTKDGSESVVLTVLELDENHLLCKEEKILYNQVYYITKLQAKYDMEKDKICGLDLATGIGYKEW